MGKILALDFGTKRIGLAVSDIDQTMSFPRDTLAKTPEKKLFERLQKIIKEEGIVKIVLGLPLGIENEETLLSGKVREFGKKLARTFLVQIDYVDESGSSDEALSKIPFRRDRREKGIKDAVSALIILQRYIDAK